MICPKCGGILTEKYYCKKCNIKVEVYNKIISTSKSYYNKGLQKAKAHNLTNAIEDLRISLKYNKKNTDARNLLGLIYFEIGEVVLALQQWIISKNLQPQDNLASKYINSIQENQNKLDRFNASIIKYNQSLNYIQQNSNDLAIIQLKKVISLNPKFVKAYCLLSLLYIKGKDYEKAKNTLIKVLNIDKNNYLALKYYEEAKSSLNELDDKNDVNIFKQPQEKIIINTDKFKNTFNKSLSYGQQAVLMLIGFVIGAFLIALVIFPTMAKEKDKKIDKIQLQLQTTSEKADSTIISLQEENDKLKKDTANMTTQLKELKGKEEYLKAVDLLQTAIKSFLDKDKLTASDTIMQIDDKALGETDAFNLYTIIKNETGKYAKEKYYRDGMNLYYKKDYKNAIDLFSKSIKLDDGSYITRDALYFTARSYKELGEKEQANNFFEQVINKYPGTKRASEAEYYKNKE